MEISTQAQEAAKFWHQHIGRFLSREDWTRSLVISYPKPSPPGAKANRVLRIGGCLSSMIMIDAANAVLIDNIDILAIPGCFDPDCHFLYGEHIKGVTNLQKTQINWALSPERVYPLLMVRPAKKGPMACLALTHTPSLHTVCVPAGNFTYDPSKVRAARDYILAGQLQAKWRKAIDLRGIIGRNEHLLPNVSAGQREFMMKMHAELVGLFPLDVWLPFQNTGEYIALGDCLAEKPELDLAKLPRAADLFSLLPN